MLEKENIIAWCIVPFDANERNPEERAAMLKELGITKLAYDYRDQHIPYFEEEINTLKAAGIELSSVWLWIQDFNDNLLDPTSESIVRIVEKTGCSIALYNHGAWFGNPENQIRIIEAIGSENNEGIWV